MSSTAPVHTAARPRGSQMAVWIDVDTWLRLQDTDPAPAQVQVAVAEPELLTDRFAELLKRLDQARETLPQSTFNAAPSPSHIHPGVQRYLREIGVMK